jgi:hypothetical protein
MGIDLDRRLTGADLVRVRGRRSRPRQTAPGRVLRAYTCVSSISHRCQPRIHVMSIDHSAPSLILKMITIRLAAEAGQYDTEARYELALNELAAALIMVNSSVSPAWTVQPVPGDDPLLYHLMPLQEDAVASTVAWEMTFALRGQVMVVAADPTFVTLWDER